MSAMSEPVLRAFREAWAGRSAHVDLDAALADLDAALRAVRPEGVPYSVWELVEHLRIAQKDLLDYTLAREHDAPPWPEGYWPGPRETVDDPTWQESVGGLKAGLAEMGKWLNDPEMDLTEDLPHSDLLPDGGRRTPLRQMLVAMDHRAYHVGEIVAVRRALGAW